MTTRKIVKYCSSIRTIFLTGLLIFSIPAIAHPILDNPPFFTGGLTQNFSVCRDASGVSINALLAIVDSDAGQTETWSVAVSPAHGTLSGFDTTATSTGGVVTPAGLGYMPTPGYVGTDTFTIQVSDGFVTATTTIFVTVNALPVLSSTLAPAAICDQTTFNYTPTSLTPGATFTWLRAFVGGISNPASSGTGAVSETLTNITYYDVPVTYVYTTTAGGCSSTQNVIVIVHPTPRLSSPLFDTTCSGSTYNYTPMTATSGTTFTWSRASVAGISPATSSGTGNISEALTDSSTAPVTVAYTFVLTANGCTAIRNLNVTVVPVVPVTTITTLSPSTVCSGILYQNFGASVPPPAGLTYTWSAVNATIWKVGGTSQFVLVNFPNPGDASVTLSVNNATGRCGSRGTFDVAVTSGISAPGSGILYYNYQLIYLDNTQDSYQWGYDLVSTLEGHIIPGADFQSYPVTVLDVANKYFWVMTSKGGCEQKTYFNAPLAITKVNTGNVANVNVYPNPAANTLNVDLNVPVGGVSEISVTNILGQTIRKRSCTGQTTQFDIADLPAGCYLVSCMQNGLKIASARFIKN